jgi:hypothetical protein
MPVTIMIMDRAMPGLMRIAGHRHALRSSHGGQVEWASMAHTTLPPRVPFDHFDELASFEDPPRDGRCARDPLRLIAPAPPRR